MAGEEWVVHRKRRQQVKPDALRVGRTIRIPRHADRKTVFRVGDCIPPKHKRSTRSSQGSFSGEVVSKAVEKGHGGGERR